MLDANSAWYTQFFIVTLFSVTVLAAELSRLDHQLLNKKHVIFVFISFTKYLIFWEGIATCCKQDESWGHGFVFVAVCFRLETDSYVSR